MLKTTPSGTRWDRRAVNLARKAQDRKKKNLSFSYYPMGIHGEELSTFGSGDLLVGKERENHQKGKVLK